MTSALCEAQDNGPNVFRCVKSLYTYAHDFYGVFYEQGNSRYIKIKVLKLH